MTLTGKTIQTIYPYERTIRGLLYLLVLLGGCYIYLINSIVFDAVAREQASQQSAALGSRVAQLESEQVALSGRVTLELAHQLGFEDTSNHTGFAYQQASEWNENL